MAEMENNNQEDVQVGKTNAQNLADALGKLVDSIANKNPHVAALVQNRLNKLASVNTQQATDVPGALAEIIESIANEEESLAALIYVEAIKLAAAQDLATIPEDLDDLNDVVASVERLLRSVVKKNIVLETKLQDALNAATSLGISPSELMDALLAVLESIAAEESALGDIIGGVDNSSGPTGGLAGTIITASGVANSLDDLIAANDAAEKVLRTIIKKEIVLEIKMQDVLDFIVTPPTPPGAVCECRASFIVPNPFPITADGTEGTGRLDRAGASEGRVRVCRTCDPARSELFEFEFTPSTGGTTTTFVATSYTPNPVTGAIGDCCVEADGTIQFTLTGVGIFNGTPNTPFTLVLQDRQASPGTATLTVGGQTFVADDLPPGLINITACPGFTPGLCQA